MNGDSGFYTSNGNVVTFEVQGAISRDGMSNSEYHNLYARYLNENRTNAAGTRINEVNPDGYA